MVMGVYVILGASTRKIYQNQNTFNSVKYVEHYGLKIIIQYF